MCFLARGGDVIKRVLFFDSGVGGLSVFDAVRQQLPGLHYLYLFDNAGFPYGELPVETLIERCRALVCSMVSQQKVDLVVIACNTASTLVLPVLRPLLNIPVVGVVPAIKPAAKLTRNGCIGLLATPATVCRPYTDKLIQEFAPHCEVLRCGSTELVIQAERKLAGLPVEQAVIESVLQDWKNAQPCPDTLVLGCTHFPLLREEIWQVLPNCALVDSGAAIARRVQHLLNITNTQVTSKLGQVYCTRLDAQAKALQRSFNLRALGELSLWAMD